MPGDTWLDWKENERAGTAVTPVRSTFAILCAQTYLLLVSKCVDRQPTKSTWNSNKISKLTSIQYCQNVFEINLNQSMYAEDMYIDIFVILACR